MRRSAPGSPSFCPPPRKKAFRKEAPPTKKKNNGLWNALIFALILVGTVYGVFHGQDIGALRQALGQCRTDWLILAAVFVVVSIACEAAAQWLQQNSFGMSMGGMTCFQSACVGFFFSAITPSATGGQPMQVYYMRKKGIPVSVTSVALLVIALFYKTVLVLAGAAMLIFAPGFLRASLGGYMFLFYIGLLLTGGWTVFLLFLIFRQRIARAILVWGMTVLEELHILKDRESHQTAFEVSMDLYQDAADHLRKHPLVMLGVFLCMIARRAAMYSVVWCVYKAMGLTGTGWSTLVLLQACVSICADMLPLPGGMGISEALFVKAYGAVFGASVLPGMILSRGIGHYSQLFFCGVVTLLVMLSLRRRNQPEED